MATITVLQNISIPVTGTGSDTLTVCEPSLSNAGDSVFVTGNRFAAESPDHGETWTYVDPYVAFPEVDGGFAGDQTSIYVPSRDLTVWVLQNERTATPNSLRVAVRTTGGNWHYSVIRPTDVDPAWTNEWFDYNSAAYSDNFLYVTSDLYSMSTGGWTRAVVLRFKLDELLTATAFPFDAFSTTTTGSLRCTLGAKSVMYFGSTHQPTLSLRLFTWPESGTAVTEQVIPVAKWSEAWPYSAKCPDGNDWLLRADGRITAAWTGAGEIGFAWTSNKGGGRPLPFVRAVRINESTKKVIAQPDIWSKAVAYAYPDVCPNLHGIPAIALCSGGNQLPPSLVIGILDAGVWKLQTAKKGTNAPADGKWGDYVTIRRHSPDGTSWIAAGHTLQGGSARTNVVPQFVHFRI